MKRLIATTLVMVLLFLSVAHAVPIEKGDVIKSLNDAESSGAFARVLQALANEKSLMSDSDVVDAVVTKLGAITDPEEVIDYVFAVMDDGGELADNPKVKQGVKKAVEAAGGSSIFGSDQRFIDEYLPGIAVTVDPSSVPSPVPTSEPTSTASVVPTAGPTSTASPTPTTNPPPPPPPKGEYVLYDLGSRLFVTNDEVTNIYNLLDISVYGGDKYVDSSGVVVDRVLSQVERNQHRKIVFEDRGAQEAYVGDISTKSLSTKPTLWLNDIPVVLVGVSAPSGIHNLELSNINSEIELGGLTVAASSTQMKINGYNPSPFDISGVRVMRIDSGAVSTIGESGGTSQIATKAGTSITQDPAKWAQENPGAAVGGGIGFVVVLVALLFGLSKLVRGRKGNAARRAAAAQDAKTKIQDDAQNITTREARSKEILEEMTELIRQKGILIDFAKKALRGIEFGHPNSGHKVKVVKMVLAGMPYDGGAVALDTIQDASLGELNGKRTLASVNSELSSKRADLSQLVNTTLTEQSDQMDALYNDVEKVLKAGGEAGFVSEAVSQRQLRQETVALLNDQVNALNELGRGLVAAEAIRTRITGSDPGDHGQFDGIKRAVTTEAPSKFVEIRDLFRSIEVRNHKVSDHLDEELEKLDGAGRLSDVASLSIEALEHIHDANTSVNDGRAQAGLESLMGVRDNYLDGTIARALIDNRIQELEGLVGSGQRRQAQAARDSRHRGRRPQGRAAPRGPSPRRQGGAGRGRQPPQAPQRGAGLLKGRLLPRGRQPEPTPVPPEPEPDAGGDQDAVLLFDENDNRIDELRRSLGEATSLNEAKRIEAEIRRLESTASKLEKRVPRKRGKRPGDERRGRRQR